MVFWMNVSKLIVINNASLFMNVSLAWLKKYILSLFFLHASVRSNFIKILLCALILEQSPVELGPTCPESVCWSQLFQA